MLNKVVANLLGKETLRQLFFLEKNPIDITKLTEKIFDFDPQHPEYRDISSTTFLSTYGNLKAAFLQCPTIDDFLALAAQHQVGQDFYAETVKSLYSADKKDTLCHGMWGHLEYLYISFGAAAARRQDHELLALATITTVGRGLDSCFVLRMVDGIEKTKLPEAEKNTLIQTIASTLALKAEAHYLPDLGARAKTALWLRHPRLVYYFFKAIGEHYQPAAAQLGKTIFDQAFSDKYERNDCLTIYERPLDVAFRGIASANNISLIQSIDKYINNNITCNQSSLHRYAQQSFIAGILSSDHPELIRHLDFTSIYTLGFRLDSHRSVAECLDKIAPDKRPAAFAALYQALKPEMELFPRHSGVILAMCFNILCYCPEHKTDILNWIMSNYDKDAALKYYQKWVNIDDPDTRFPQDVEHFSKSLYYALSELAEEIQVPARQVLEEFIGIL